MKRGQQRNSTAGHRSRVLRRGAISSTLEELNGYVTRMRRYQLTDEQYEMIRDLLPANGRRGGQWNSHRTTLNGMFWILHTGAQWREMPERYGRAWIRGRESLFSLPWPAGIGKGHNDRCDPDARSLPLVPSRSITAGPIAFAHPYAAPATCSGRCPR